MRRCALTAPRIGQSQGRGRWRAGKRIGGNVAPDLPLNLVGLPAITLPCGFDRDGLPIGLQIAARPFNEQAVIQAAHSYEAAHAWKERHPIIAVKALDAES